MVPQYRMMYAIALLAGCFLASQNYFTVSAQFAKAQAIELEATPVSGSEVRLNWRIHNPGVIGGIRIYRADFVTPDNFVFMTVIPARALSFIDSGLMPGSTWVYRIQTQGKNPIKLSAPSNAVRVTTPAAGSDPGSDELANPNQPRITIENPALGNAIQTLAARAINPNQIELKWAIPGLPRVAALRLYRSSSLDPHNFALLASLGAHLKSYLDSNLQPRTTYYYRMKYSFNGASAHLSPPSNPASATTPDGRVPNPRVGVAVERPKPGIPFELPPTGIGSAVPYDKREEEVLYQLNQYRASRGVGPVRPSVSLSQAADMFSRQLAARGASRRHDAGSLDTKNRARSFGYYYDTSFDTVVFTSKVDPVTMFELLKIMLEESLILLAPAWKVVGIGRSYNEHDGSWRWVFDFAAYWDKTIPLPGEDTDGRIDGNERVRTRPPADALMAGAKFTGYGDDGKPYSSKHCDTESGECWKDPAPASNRSLMQLSLPENMIGTWHVKYQVSSKGVVHFNDPDRFDLTEFAMTLTINEDGSWMSQGYKAGQTSTSQEAGTWKWVHDAGRDEEIVTFYRDEGRPAAVIRVHAAPNVMTFYAVDGGDEMEGFFKGIPADGDPKDDPQIIFVPGPTATSAPAGPFQTGLRCDSCPRAFTRW